MLIKDKKYEKKREFAVRFVFFLYFLFLITGSLRKWFLPELAAPLTLLSDPFVLALYAYCLLNRLIMYHSIASIWLKFAVFSSIFGLLQYMARGYPIEGWMLGIRAYWLYTPLAFIVAATFQPQDVMRFFKFNLWIAPPYAILMSFQYRSSPYDFINWGVGAEQDSAVGVALNILRPFGLFTYTGPNVLFSAAMTAMLVAVYLAGSREHPNKIIFLIMTLAVGTIDVLTGSRIIYFFAALILGLTILGLMYNRFNTNTFIRVIFILGFVVLSGFILTRFFPDMFLALQLRIDLASQIEGSIWNRALSSFSILNAMESAPVFGYGIGAGASGVASFLGLQSLIFGESDLERNINELGLIFGSILVILRWFTSFWVLKRALTLSRKRLFIPLPLAGFVILSFTVGQITFSSLLSFFPWLFFGIILACRNVSSLPINFIPTTSSKTPQLIQILER